MKNNFKKIVALFFVASFALTGCEEEVASYDVDGGPTAFMFNSPTSSLSVLNQTEPSAVLITVGVTTRSDVDRSFVVTVDPESTATPGTYTIDQASLVIPAGEFVGNIRLSTNNAAALPIGSSRTVILNLEQSGVVQDIVDNKSVHTVSLARFCAPEDLAGSYTVTTTYQSHDFLPAYATNTMNVEVSATPTARFFSVADFSGGLYSSGPYSTAPGYGGPFAANAIDLVFREECGAISWTGQTEPYGALIPTPNAVNSYNTATGVITISWTAVRFGERGVSVYTPR